MPSTPINDISDLPPDANVEWLRADYVGYLNGIAECILKGDLAEEWKSMSFGEWLMSQRETYRNAHGVWV